MDTGPLKKMSAVERFVEILEQFETAMLVTRDGDGRLHARPLAVAGREVTGDLWFVTSTETSAFEEAQEDGAALVTMQGGGTYLAIGGVAEVLRSRQRLEELWRPTWRAFYPDGLDTPDLVLIRLVAHEAEYWDRAGIRGVIFALQAAKAFVKGERTGLGGEQLHGHVEL